MYIYSIVNIFCVYILHIYMYIIALICLQVPSTLSRLHSVCIFGGGQGGQEAASEPTSGRAGEEIKYIILLLV